MTLRVRAVLRILVILFGGYVVLLALVYFRQRSMLFLPSHSVRSGQLVPWTDGPQ